MENAFLLVDDVMTTGSTASELSSAVGSRCSRNHGCDSRTALEPGIENGMDERPLARASMPRRLPPKHIGYGK